MEEIKNSQLFDLEHTIAKDIFDGKEYPFEILPEIESFILALGETLPKDKFEKRGENIWVAKSATVAASASLTGPLIIDEEAEIRHCAFIRGKAIVGKHAVVGNSTELKNVILFDRVQVPHYNYVGDSILGFKSHMGCGSILNPGTIVGSNTNIYPLSSVRGYVPGGSIYKKQGEIAQKR